MSISTYQDMQAATDLPAWVASAIEAHKQSDMYRTAKVADDYYKWRNRTVEQFAHILFDAAGNKLRDHTASNLKIKTNLFHRLNVQRCMYSLGKDVTFEQAGTAGKLGPQFHDRLIELGRYALIHGLAFAVWDEDHMDVRKVTETLPVWDEETGALRAAVYFCRIDREHPMTAVLYEEDGFTVMAERGGSLKVSQPKRGYVLKYDVVPADGLVSNVTEENYTALPVIPVWGSDQHQSTLVGMRESIDAYDLIKSGFANDVQDCAQVYWIVENCGGMQDEDLMRYRDRLKLTHIANADTEDGGKITPYTQEVPHEARTALLQSIKAGIYEDFGALDVHTVAAGATNDHVDAAYQPMDEEAHEFEKHMREAVRNLLALQGIDDEPKFTRTRVSNQYEQVQMVMAEAQYLDDETILNKLPNIAPDEVQGILERRDAEAAEKMAAMPMALQQNAGLGVQQQQQPGEE